MVLFRVGFSKDVVNVDMSDFSVEGATTAGVTSVVSLNGMSYEVVVSGGDLATFNGTVGLALSPTNNVVDRMGCLLHLPPKVNEAFQIDNAPPHVVSFTR